MAEALTLEIVEGPGAGRQLELLRSVVIGRGDDVDLRIPDNQASRRHARVTPTGDGSAVVEDLDSANGTFVNDNQVYAPARIDAGDELLIGVTVIQLRSPRQIAAQPSMMVSVPAALRIEPRPPDYVDQRLEGGAVRSGGGGGAGIPELDRYLDVRVRRRAQFAPLAVLLLVALALAIYFATR